MSIKIAIQHNTYYRYDSPVQMWPQTIRLKPAPHTRTEILSYSLKISPSNHFINWLQDPFGNYMARVVFPEKVDHFFVEVEVIADLIHINPFDFFLEDYADKFPFEYEEGLKKELAPYFEVEENGELFNTLKQESKLSEAQSTIDYLVDLNQRVYKSIDYTIRLEPGIQTCEETMKLGSGSCRDTAWLLVQLLRSHGLAARFASGYLVQLTPDQKSNNGADGPSEDFTDLHAWAEVYIPGAGWIGLDTTSGLFTSEGHIPLSCTPSPSSAAAISGFVGPTKVDFQFTNMVKRLNEGPRVTKPYQVQQWEDILAYGKRLDERVEQERIRLVMGGEPTFVSVENMDAEEWNQSADGEEKREKGYNLALKMKAAMAPKGMIHQGQGKWYPGEPIPRWQYVIYWRKDQYPLWKNDKWLANPNRELDTSMEEGRKFLNTLSHHLGLTESIVQPVYEDIYYFLWEQSKLPLGTDPFSMPKEGSLEQQKLAELLNHGLENEVGFILPLRFDPFTKQWVSCKWNTGRDRLYLIPGNSSLGYRLPLSSLAETDSDEEQKVLYAPSPMEELPPLSKDNSSYDSLKDNIQGDNSIKTALSVEIRNGILYVFLPPLEDLDFFIDLIGQIEKTCEATGIPIIIEGYQPPSDNRLEQMSVTPDPGVIEVNMKPAGSWSEIVRNYKYLFESAKEVNLGAEKFMLDGNHTGTGGGNHITLGGHMPYDSPLLRRPDLLRSMVSFWQNHPGLSYLFSSAFVGPTSQAPRVDEGRKNILLELQIAFKELDKYPNPSPWLVDRIFRNLLVDITGNTHRAEFCIDKLYNPNSKSGRMGILELRGFDMPPNVEMCLVQILLIRALVVSFWECPYRFPLIDWGTDLHDKYLLHYYVKQDMEEVVRYLNQGRDRFELEWLDCFFEFRFPVLGRTVVQGIEIVIRKGIEPWNVLGEEMSNSGTARFVDSSVEKIEILVKGIQKERYQLLCNRVVLPLQPTQKPDTYVVGVKYKAWNPPSALHPTIGVNSPLTFDIYDTWNKCSIGGCVYHVVHPGGRSYETFPINTMEAEGRRITRFFKNTHSAIPNDIIQDSMNQGDSIKRFVVDQSQSDHILEPISRPDLVESKHTVDLRQLV
ncbi:transglutaminase family protein [Membranihabitans marinus]|uniref:transglutaminase family protein n=1 Tax=Membranihabitans marinus TaxID=1227546 RepID=UPI001F2F691E|nr:transglutaminase family protein [Membranihabitans marinus]